jgi:hypothetical protein
VLSGISILDLKLLSRIPGPPIFSAPKGRCYFWSRLTELVQRWTPAHLHEQPLDITLGEIRRRTREFFQRLFGGA